MSDSRRERGPATLSEYRQKRDFGKTAEPEAGRASSPASGDGLRFVVQKHAASHLHYDLRLEMEGVMRSWAVPKGPSLDPDVRRLAMEVEDHPIAYNEFEGTIPEGEYGGGTVMLWDVGTYTPDDCESGESPEETVVRAYRKGKLSITFHGERLQGSFALVRTDSVEGGVRSKWLLIKQKDAEADSGVDVTEEVKTSVVSGRTMDEIAAGAGGKRVWQSNRSKPKLAGRSAKKRSSTEFPDLRPMLARTGTEIPASGDWVFEPKYDGIRVLAFATAEGVALVTRNGHDKSGQFPEVAEALSALVEDVGESLVLDGELVALDNGEIARFGALQARMHVRSAGRVRRLAEESPAAFVAFDILLRGTDVLVPQRWTERRGALEEVVATRETECVRLAQTSRNAEALIKRGRREGWEGVVAKRMDAPYRTAQRSADWLKLKLENRQELVVGGWTEPRKSRKFLGAILLGYYDANGKLVYAGHTGAGFTGALLEEMHRRLSRLERKTPPFTERPKTNERAHWTTPKVVVEVKFNEWTRDGKLRQPVFIGIRDDKDPTEVVREDLAARVDRSAGDGKRPDGVGDHEKAAPETPTSLRILEIRERSGEGKLRVGGGSLPITSLEKVFYPETGHAKGDLFLYYARMAEHILPWMKDRPLVLKRFPNGVAGESFYQQTAPDPVPTGVRVDTLEVEGKAQRRLVGGTLATLLYTIQLGAISYDPWHSRVTDLSTADYTVLDLDPGPGVDFQQVVAVARWVKEEMDELGLHGAVKTSGSTGLHIYLPLPRGVPLDAATLVAQIIATRVARKHPKQATVERMTKKRPRGTIYVDYLQNILGKTVAGVYAARAKDRPMVSTPLSWDELTDQLDIGAFTVDTVPARVATVGDLWSPALARPNDLRRLRAD
ncbi:MAG: DNA ligase D [Gemmatimonadota bacterium]